MHGKKKESNISRAQNFVASISSATMTLCQMRIRTRLIAYITGNI